MGKRGRRPIPYGEYKKRPIRERLEKCIERPNGDDGCWEWTGNMRKGYGRFSLTVAYKTKRDVPAHRVAYETFIGPIPDGLQLDHLCRNKGCVNPKHLEPVTCRENLLRRPYSVNAKKHKRVSTNL